ncbi:hypothetical protein LPJ64_001936 [Coemansia asiatica]|uniref:AB hydrolase-1 domain-containing protein n=1 Tax=Coemansia asiatica TaxID=1052880 RepID=A0A9W7XP11_9FUNG|nr:hypothetical protein LPJ64_001936 [Coemansia asiatica]
MLKLFMHKATALDSLSPPTAAMTSEPQTQSPDIPKPDEAAEAVGAALAWNPFRHPKNFASMFRLWGKVPTTKTEHAAEVALLAHGGIAVSTDDAPAASSSGTPARIIDVEIDDSGNYIHTLAITGSSSSSSSTNDTAKPRRNLVMTHGYFTGIGFFFRNYHELSKTEDWNIYSIDWLGMGRSSRPSYTSKRLGSEDERVANAESFFVESLEEWRKRMGLDKMTLCGHSFGGYMSTLYALKYPEHVERLVLISPIGIPRPPEGYDQMLREGRGPLRRPRGTTPEPDSNKVSNSSVNSSTDKGATLDPPGPSMRRTLFFRVAMGLWERNYAPQWLVRSVGPFGRRLIDMYVGRFVWLPEEQRASLAAYAYQISVLPGSSEYALGDILRPGAFARRPLVDRIAGITVPITFMYGANDWVDSTGGEEAIRELGGRVKTSLFHVPKAGHNLHLENPADFNRILISEMGASI